MSVDIFLQWADEFKHDSEGQQLGSARVNRDAQGSPDTPEIRAPETVSGPSDVPAPCPPSRPRAAPPPLLPGQARGSNVTRYRPHIGGREVEHSAGSLLLASPLRAQELEMTGPCHCSQYEKAFSPKYLQNWSLAKPTKERISSHEGYTQIIANDRGHLLPSVPRSKASPWGSFMGTWQMPLKVPPARVTLTSRTAAGAASLTKWIQKNPDLLKASNGLHPEILGKPHDPDSQKKLEKSITKTVQQAPSPTIILSSPESNLNSPDQLQSSHHSEGHTPGPQSPPNSPKSPPGSPCMLEHCAGPNLAEVQKCKPGTP
ncbi:protein Flattop [Eubalaena glacialis]|uniref:protein Flattop n=1 Tax=Eubalaena glacialis TaxID=27606 RepID=UPI002A5A1A16|nr:protein Flattop [Eubalaena glacialis]